MEEQQERYYVVRTHCYGKRPHDNYAVTMANGDIAVTEMPTLAALLEAMGASGYVVQEDIIPVMDALASSSGVEQSDEERLAFAKEMMARIITAYDTSSSVNGFKLNGTVFWLDKGTRVGLMNSTTITKAMGSTTTDLWLGEVKLTIDCDKVIQLLSGIEMYALECFNVTAAHKAAVEKLETVEEVEGYDYKSGYPEQLSIEV